MGSMKQIPFTRIEDISFRVYSDEEIEKISVINVTNENSINSLGHYLDHGVYDLHMGPLNQKDSEMCKTCRNKFFQCSGHCGHIDLPLPLYNPFFYNILLELLLRICPVCFRFQVSAIRGIQFVFECKLLAAGFDLQSLDVAKIVRNFIHNPDEALEGEPAVDGREIASRTNDDILAHSLLKKLKEFLKAAKRNEEASIIPTCTSQVTYTILQKSFLADTYRKHRVCMFCKKTLLNVRYQNSQILLKNDPQAPESLIPKPQPYITPVQVKTILRECLKKDGIILKHLYPVLDHSALLHPTDMFFLQKLLVIPPKFRPCSQAKGAIIEAEMSFLYKAVLRLTRCLRFLGQFKENTQDIEVPESLRFLMAQFKGRTTAEKSHSLWHELQGTIDNILDSEMNPAIRISPRGVRQIIEKKMGLFRRNLMGKRVDYSARSVAAPDPMLAVDEVGVPQDFAMKLTYPVPVTPWNVATLRKLVQNGPLQYPGALIVEDEEGKKIALKATDENQRSAIAKSLLTPAESCVKRVNATKIIYRHLLSGDYVLMNRQPTLHKPSIQAHKAKIMARDRVFRLPYSSCKAYNADFDGDELNLHFPQNELARSEAQHIITTHNQYVTPKDGSPLAGLIQDCIVASVTLTVRGKFFSLEDYQQLVFVAIGDIPRRIQLLTPAIIKPQRLWSGKQIISTILLNIIPKDVPKPSFTFKTTVKVDMWNRQEPRECRWGGSPEAKRVSMTESEFVMRDGELLCGVADKCAIGSTSYGLVHTCHDFYGGGVSSQLLTAINRVCVVLLQWEGHTISLKEFVTSSKAARRRRNDIKALVQKAPYEVSKKLGVKPEDLERHVAFIHSNSNQTEMSVADAAYTSVLGPTTSAITSENEKNLLRNNLKNRMRMMVDTGAKGSKVNMNQMASLFGSVALDGKRMPISVTGKTLPSFKPYECDPRAGGYITSRFVTGMDPKSYFFLCIVGRDSLQHTAVKTANSGYMQRCLIKHLEGIRVKYDMTVRNSDDLVLQFDYGEDGLDVSKVPFLHNFDTLDSIMNFFNKGISHKELEIARKLKSPQVDQYKKWGKKHNQNWKKGWRTSAFLRFCRDQEESDCHMGVTRNGRSENAIRLQDQWRALPSEQKAYYKSFDVKFKRGQDPVTSVFCGSSNLGVVSEALDALIEDYYVRRYSCRRAEEQVLTKQMLVDHLHLKALRCRVDPGEAVGALCAQAIGEPLTQMTLNTFHFAGRDELNVTLGVPRMIEILRTASDRIKTPIMEVPFKPHVTPKVAEKLRVMLTPVPLEKVLNKVTLTTSLEKRSNFLRRVEVMFLFLPFRTYKKTYFIRPQEILTFMEKAFFRSILIREINAAIGRAQTFGASSEESKRMKENLEKEEMAEAVAIKRGMEESDSEEEIEESLQQVADTGVSSCSRHQKHEERDYSEDEEEEEEIERKVTIEEMEEGIEGGGEEKQSAKTKKSLLDNILPSDEEDNEFDKADEQVKSPTKPTPSVRKPKKPLAFNPSDVNDAAKRRNFVVSQDQWIVDYDYDQEESLWCKVTLELPVAEGRYDVAAILQSLAGRTLVHCMANIKKAFVVQADHHMLLRTEGVNIQKITAFEKLLDINRLYSNNIHLMTQIYGIEAAQRCIIKEIRAVQSAYDIKVDFRHLSLLADYFTCEGVYKACSRFALNTCSSPIQKMSYETCFQFLKKVLIQGMPDRMCSPSANVMVGQPVKVGTNSMEILSKLTVGAN